MTISGFESSNTCLYGIPRHNPAYPLLFEADLLTTGISLDQLVSVVTQIDGSLVNIFEGQTAA